MPLNMNDPNVQAEVQPPALRQLGTWLKAHYGVGADNFGIKGDANHLSGYHRSRNTLVKTPGASGSGDYSIQHALDTQNMSWNDCSACDFTPHAWGSAENNRRMIDITNRMYAAALARDPRVQQCREFAGTFDGASVVRFRCDGGAIQSPFDSSHLEHGHWSFWRSRVNWSHQGLFEVITGEESAMRMILVAEQPGAQVWLSNMITRRPILDAADLNNVRTQAGGFWGSEIWSSGTILNVGVGGLHVWGVDVTAGNPVELTPEQLEEIYAAAREGAESADAATADEVAEVVDRELDQHFAAGANDDA